MATMPLNSLSCHTAEAHKESPPWFIGGAGTEPRGQTPRMWHLWGGPGPCFGSATASPSPAQPERCLGGDCNAEIGTATTWKHFSLWAEGLSLCLAGLGLQECPCCYQCQCLYKCVTHQEIRLIVTVLWKISALRYNPAKSYQQHVQSNRK